MKQRRVSLEHQKAFVRWRTQPQTMVRELFGVEPDGWQDKVLAAFPTTPRIALQAPISVEATVPTPSGPRRWGDIKVGHYVIAEDGTPSGVTGRFDQGEVDLYRVTFSDGSSVNVCGEHIWKVQSPYDRKCRNRWRTLSTKALLKSGIKLPSGQNNFSIPIQGDAWFQPMLIPLDPYLFGLWLGDGVCNEPTDIWSDGISGLRQSGASRLKSHEKFIPFGFKMGTVAERWLLIRGMMDADGTVAANGQTYLASSSEKLVDDFIWVARSLGCCAWKSGPYPHQGYRDGYRATISGPECPFLANTDKKRRWHRPEEYHYTRFIESIEPVGRGDAMCIEIDHKSHCFLIGDFIVTHNCKGPGKTTTESWIGWNFMLTRPHANVAATSITGKNLEDGLWKEMAKWQNQCELLKNMFEWQKTRIVCRQHPETWFMSARTWDRKASADVQAQTLAGFHADYVLFLLDETGGMPVSVLSAAEAALATGIEAHIVQAGNPTEIGGALHNSVTQSRGQWLVFEISGDPDDPDRASRVDTKWASDMIARWGRESPYVLVNVFGKFPPGGINQLVSVEVVEAAIGRHYREFDYRGAPRILGVDVAREGDDSSIVFPRQGIVAFSPDQYRNIDSIQGAGAVSRKSDEWEADAIFVDATGGFGWGWIDQLRQRGYSPIPVMYNGAPHDKARYFNKRAEMAFDCKEWLERGGAIPDIPELKRTLTEVTYGWKGDALVIEPKEDLKMRLGFSPDHMDALMQTFAEPVQPRYRGRSGATRHKFEWTPGQDVQADSRYDWRPR